MDNTANIVILIILLSAEIICFILHTVYMCKYIKETKTDFHWTEVFMYWFDSKYMKLLFKEEDNESTNKYLARTLAIATIVLFFMTAVFINTIQKEEPKENVESNVNIYNFQR